MRDPNNGFPSGDEWDEYQWERFLQDQDRATEKYFRLLEKFLDHPDRDALIASEMGWSDCPTDPEIEELAAYYAESGHPPDEVADAIENEFERFAKTRIYRDALMLHRWIHALFGRDERIRAHPEATRLSARSALCGAKIAAALCGDDSSEIGMTLAYLKRALKAANDALDAIAKLSDAGLLETRRAQNARRLVFRIRDRIVNHMREFRTEWLKRQDRG